MKNSPKKTCARKILPYKKKGRFTSSSLTDNITSVNTWSTWVLWAWLLPAKSAAVTVITHNQTSYTSVWAGRQRRSHLSWIKCCAMMPFSWVFFNVHIKSGTFCLLQSGFKATSFLSHQVIDGEVQFFCPLTSTAFALLDNYWIVWIDQSLV